MRITDLKIVLFDFQYVITLVRRKIGCNCNVQILSIHDFLKGIHLGIAFDS